MQRVFDVALWVTWPSLFPEYVALVSASSTFAAVVSVMRSCGLSVVAHATESTCDGSLVYRAIGIKILCEREMLHS